MLMLLFLLMVFSKLEAAVADNAFTATASIRRFTTTTFLPLEMLLLLLRQ